VWQLLERQESYRWWWFASISILLVNIVEYMCVLRIKALFGTKERFSDRLISQEQKLPIEPKVFTEARGKAHKLREKPSSPLAIDEV